MDEYEKLEEELAVIYDTYVTKYRCLVYLDIQLEDLEKAEYDELQIRKEQIRKMIEQMREEENLRGEATLNGVEYKNHEQFNGGSVSVDDDIDEIDNGKSSQMLTTGSAKISSGDSKHQLSAIKTSTAITKRNVTSRLRVFGSMLSDDKDESIDSDIDIDDGDEDASDLDSEVERELLSIKDVKKKNKDEDSDNDF